MPLAIDGRIVRRALVTSLVVGTILTAVNHGPDILQRGLPVELLWPVVVTFLTPFLVATISCVATIRAGEAAHLRRDVP
jgi:hypothetical protein